MRTFLLIGLLTLSPNATLVAQSKPDVKKEPTATTTAGATAGQQVSEDSHSESFWMEQKIELSKAILHALTSGDYESITKNSVQMQRIGKFERLVRSRNVDYRKQLKVFESANALLIDSSKKKDLRGSLKAFHELTSSCVQCHELLRSESK